MGHRDSPCNGCTERFTACSGRCPKDARGEYGYKAWLADFHKVKAAEKEYKRQRREDFLHSEESASNIEKWRLRRKHGR